MNGVYDIHPFKLPPASAASTYMLFKIYIVKDGLTNEEYETLKNVYMQQIKNHNLNVLNNTHSDSGFDLYCPRDLTFHGVDQTNLDMESQSKENNHHVNRLDLHVRVAAYVCYNKYSFDKLELDANNEHFNLLGSDNLISCVPRGYYLYPRSSIYKTPMRLANSVGIIDSGYRGNIMAMVDVKNNCTMHIKESTRYFQLTSGDLSPFLVYLCDEEHELGETNRGTGGFGSTGGH